jgi:two-component system, NtrC family, C4-dicarboxylate transport response regulator DctD
MDNMTPRPAPGSAGLVRLIEDDAPLLAAQVQGLRLQGFATEAFEAPLPALAGLGPDYPGVVLSDVRLPGIDGLELAARIRALDPELPVILLTGHGDVAMAVQALKDGAYDFLTKPVGMAPLQATLRRALETRRLVLENRALRQQTVGGSDSDGLIGQSPLITHLRDTVLRLAEAGVDALITGASGVGKEQLARAIHRQSPRRARPFVHVNCAALSPERFDTEFLGLAGQRGAQARSLGRIERANRGLLFLDEIDALPLDLQARLLDVIERGAVWPLGADVPRPVDLWVLASTRRDLAAEVAAGRFRADLYYRLSGVVLTLPPLRERREDVPLLFRHFALRIAARLGRRVPPLTLVQRAHLDSHDWPGNLRELDHYAERHVLDLTEPDPRPEPATSGLADLVAAYEAALLRDALRLHKGNATAAMARLQLPRKTFYDKLARHGIRSEDFRESDRA